MKILNRLVGILVCTSIPLTAFAQEWEWSTQPTPGSQNEIITENGEPAENYTNGTLSDAIILSEIMPNPEGTDNDTEWIELYNTGTTNVDLGNWSLDDEEGGSSPYIFPAGSIIEAQDFLVIYRSDSKISLNNDTDQVRLFDFEGTPKDDVTYKGSPEGQSYARISLEPDTSGALAWLIPTTHAATWYEAPWEWTKETSVGTTNPIYHAISGTILEWIPFEDQIKLQNKNQTMAISLADLDINEELKESIFSVGNQIKGYATLKNNLFSLKRFEEITPTDSVAPSPTKSQKTLYLFLLIACGTGALIYRRKISSN